jgi:hypothetical protein
MDLCRHLPARPRDPKNGDCKEKNIAASGFTEGKLQKAMKEYHGKGEEDMKNYLLLVMTGVFYLALVSSCFSGKETTDIALEEKEPSIFPKYVR